MMLWIVLGVLGSLGLHSFVHTFLYEPRADVPQHARSRAMGHHRLRRTCRRQRMRRRGLDRFATTKRSRDGAVAALLIALSIHDVLPVIRWEHALEVADPAYEWLRGHEVHRRNTGACRYRKASHNFSMNSAPPFITSL